MKYSMLFNHLILIMLAGMFTSCGNSGDINPDDKEIKAPKSVEPGNDNTDIPREPIGTGVDLSSGTAFPDTPCQQERRLGLAEIPEDEPIILDGMIDLPGGTEITSESFSGLVSIKAFKRGDDLYLYGKSGLSSDVKLIFNGVRYFDKTLHYSESIELNWSRSGNITLKVGGEIFNLSSKSTPSRGAYFKNGSDHIVEIELSSAHLKSILEDQMFWIEPFISNSKTKNIQKADAHKIFESYAKVEGSLETVNSCMGWLGSRSGENLQVISFYDGADAEDLRLDQGSFSYLRYITSSLSKYLGWESRFQPITLITSPYEKTKYDRPWNTNLSTVSINDDGLRENGSTIDGRRISSAEYIYQVIRKQVERNQSFKSEITKEIYVTTLAHKFLKVVYGSRFIFNIKNYLFNQVSEISRSRLEVRKIKILSMLLSQGLKLEEVDNIFSNLENEVALSVGEVIEKILTLSPSLFGERSAEYFKLFENAVERDQLFETLSFNDLDYDGLFDSMEFLLGTIISKADSDDDGWVDSTEVFKGKNPLNLSDRPTSLIVDGFENDWFTIIPQKLSKNTYVNKECPASADITYYSALYGKGSLVVLGTTQETVLPDDERRSYWFVDVKLESLDLTLTIAASTEEDKLEVTWDHDGLKRKKIMYRNQTRSLSGIEWELPLRELGIGWLPDNIAVKAKVSTAFSKNRIDICDETKWIEPLGI